MQLIIHIIQEILRGNFPPRRRKLQPIRIRIK